MVDDEIVYNGPVPDNVELREIMLDNDDNVVESSSEPPSSKRLYQKISQQQIDTLKKVYAVEGPNYSLLKYSDITGIKPERLRKVIRKLQKGEGIDKVNVRKGKMRLLGKSDGEILLEEIKRNNRATLRQLQEAIKAKTNKVVSISTVQRTLTMYMKRDGLPTITLKRFVSRGSRVCEINNLKEERKIVVRKFLAYLESGYRPIFVDESHWMMGLVTGRARAEIGTTPVVHMANSATHITVIASMSDIKMHYSQVVYGENSSIIFRTYIQYLLDDIKELGKCLIFMDNCKIHHSPDTEKLIKDSGNELLFNTPYSPPLNPIEMVFGIWKRRSETCSYCNREEIIKKIADSFKTITPSICFKSVNKVLHTNFRKVINDEDI